MTIGVNNRMDYVGAGSTDTYSYNFKIFAATDLLVTQRDTDGVETTLAYPADFGVSGVGVATGGSIVLTDGNLPTGYALAMRRVRTIAQTTDIRNQSQVFNDVLEDTYDALVMIDQQQQDELDRSLKFPETDGLSGSTVLPGAAERAGGSLAFDGDGNPIAGPALGDLVAEVAAAAASASAADASADAAAADAATALSARVDAIVALAAAELAKDGALAAQRIYPSTAAGVAAVASGDYFYIVSASIQNTLELWWDNAGVATDTGKRFAASDAFKSTVETVGTTTVLTTSQQFNVQYVWTPLAATTKEGYLDTVSFIMSGIVAGTQCVVGIILFEFLGGTSYRMHEWRVTVANGLNTFTAAAGHFDPIYVPVGSRVGGFVRNPTGAPVQSLDVRTELVGGTAVAFKVTDMDGGTLSKYFEGLTVSPTADAVNTHVPLLSFTLAHFDKSFKDDYSNGVQDLLQGKQATKTRLAEVVRGRTTINRTSFPGVATPTGWTLGGGAVSSGLTFAVPGNSAFAAYNTDSSLNYGGAIAKFTVTDTAAKFGIAWDSQGTDYGGYVEIDGTTNKLKIMQWTGGVGTAPTDLAAYGRSAAIAALVVGRSYTMVTRRKGHNYEVVLIDSVTQTATTITTTPFASSLENFNGRAGFLHRAGSASGIKCTYFERFASFEKPKVIVLGDSNAYGMALDNNFMQNVPGDWVNAWPYLLDTARGRGDVLNASRPGETSAGLAGRLTIDLNLWSPDYVVIAMGTNDTVQATWRTNIQTVITAVLARGALPVLCTLPPRADRQAFLTAVNADIRTSFFGDYPYIDLAFALTSGNDSVTWNTSFDIGDGVHFNKAGHAAAYNQLKLDASFLLAG